MLSETCNGTGQTGPQQPIRRNGTMPRTPISKAWMLGVATTVLAATASIEQAAAQPCPAMRKINIGVSVAPPNVVHTSPYVAKELGFFAKRCIDANIVQFE